MSLLICILEHIKSFRLAIHYREDLVQPGYIEDPTDSIVTAADDESMTTTNDRPAELEQLVEEHARRKTKIGYIENNSRVHFSIDEVL
jgi:hypothetical protein